MVEKSSIPVRAWWGTFRDQNPAERQNRNLP